MAQVNKEQLKKLIKLVLLDVLKDLQSKQAGGEGAAPAAPAQAPMPQENLRHEVSTSAGAPGFQTPKAFDGKKKKKR